MNHIEKRIKNVKDNVSMVRLLKYYNLYPFTYETDDFQMRCPFHSNGKEQKQSSHVYNGKTFTCFTCGDKNNWDVLDFAKEKEQIEEFSEILRFFEQKFNLQKVAYDPREDFHEPKEKKSTDVTVFDLHKVLEKQIISMKKSLTLHRYAMLFYLIDLARDEENMDLMKKVQAKIRAIKKEAEVTSSAS